MDLSPRYRFEGSVFFVYDHNVLQKEVDLLEDAIMYFYPHTMPIDNQCLLCGQLMGLVQFSQSLFASSPILYRFKKEKFAVKHVGQYSFALAGSNIEPDSSLIEQLDRLYSLFAFYHGSVDQVKIDCGNDKEMFLLEMRSLWEQYLAFIRNYGDNLPSVFNPVPYLPVKNIQSSCFLKASHILQACQRRPEVIAGCILYNRYILCSQLMDSISRCLLLLKPNQNHHPAIPLGTDFQLPYGVRLFSVYLTKADLNQLLDVKENSPYRTNHDTSTSLSCCCRTKKTVRRNGRPPCHAPGASDAQDSGRHSMAASEPDPLGSSCGHSSENGATLCRAVEELIFKGLKSCCKCGDDTEGEQEEGSLCEDSLEDGVWTKDGEMADNVVVDEGDMTENLTDQYVIANETARGETTSDLEEKATHSGVTLEGESGIEVTCSDLHSSTATPLEQTSICSREGQHQVEHGDFQQEIKIDSSQPGSAGIGCRQTAGDIEGSPATHGTLNGYSDTLQTNADSRMEHGRLEDTPEDYKGKQEASDGDTRSQQLPRVGLAGTSGDSEGSYEVIEERKSQGELVDVEGWSGTPSDDHGSQRISDDNGGSYEVIDGRKSQEELVDVIALSKTLSDDHESQRTRDNERSYEVIDDRTSQEPVDEGVWSGSASGITHGILDENVRSQETSDDSGGPQGTSGDNMGHELADDVPEGNVEAGLEPCDGIGLEDTDTACNSEEVSAASGGNGDSELIKDGLTREGKPEMEEEDDEDEEKEVEKQDGEDEKEEEEKEDEKEEKDEDDEKEEEYDVKEEDEEDEKEEKDDVKEEEDKEDEKEEEDDVKEEDKEDEKEEKDEDDKKEEEDDVKEEDKEDEKEGKDEDDKKEEEDDVKEEDEEDEKEEKDEDDKKEEEDDVKEEDEEDEKEEKDEDDEIEEEDEDDVKEEDEEDEKEDEDKEDEEAVREDEEKQEDKETHGNHVSGSKCCGVDDLVHANLFVQAHSEIVLILLTDCDLQQNEDVIKSLWNTSLSELGELDILMRHSSKGNKEVPQVQYNYLLYDNFDKTMSGNLKEPVFAVDHVFCDTAKTLHTHFENAPQLTDVTLRNLHTNIYGRRTLSKEVYFQENLANSLSSHCHQPQDASSYLEKKVQERLLKDHGLHLV